MRKLMLLSFAALAALLLCNVAPSAQATKDDEPEAEGYWKTYSLDGLLADPERDSESEDVVPRVTPVLAAGPLRPEYGERFRKADTWSLRSGLRRGRLTAHDQALGLAFEIAINHVTQAETKLHTTPAPVLEVWANEDGHKLTQQIFEALREWYSLKSEVTVYRLAEPHSGCVLSAKAVAELTENATLLGQQTGEPGETLVWRDMDFQTCLTDYQIYTMSEDYTPEATYTRYPRGWEVAAGVLPIGEGGMLVHGYAGAANVENTRKLVVGRTDLEVPRITSRYHPSTATLTPGEGMLLDGRYLLVPSLSETVRPRRYKNTIVTLPISVMRIGDMAQGAWPGDIKADSGFPETHEYAGLELVNTGGESSVQKTAEEFRKQESLHGSYVERIGPLLVIAGEELIEPEDREADTEFEDVVRRLKRGPGWISCEVQLFSVKAESLKPNPSFDWMRENGLELASYTSAALVGQVVDWHDLQAETYYACSDNGWVSDPTLDPIMRTAVAGTRVRLLATTIGAATNFDVAASYAPSLEIKQSAVPDPTGSNAESAVVNAVQLRLQTDLKPNEAASSIVPFPGDESKRLVLFVKRVK